MSIHNEDKAAELLATMDEQIKQIQANQPEHKTRVLLVYGAPGTYMAALPNSLNG